MKKALVLAGGGAKKDLWDINNGRTLCVSCHKKTETYGVGK